MKKNNRIIEILALLGDPVSSDKVTQKAKRMERYRKGNHYMIKPTYGFSKI